MAKAISPATSPVSPRRQDAWTSAQAYLLAVFCLILGVAIGYLFRGSASPVGVVAASSPASGNVADGSGTRSGAPQPQEAAQRKEMLDRALAPLLGALQANADDFDTVTKVANLYYDAQQYPEAIQYYARAAKIQPQNPDVLTDFGTSLWYAGDADGAIAQFQTALKHQPGRAPLYLILASSSGRAKMIRKARCRPGKNCCRKIRTIPRNSNCRSSSNEPSSTLKDSRPRVVSISPTPAIQGMPHPRVLCEGGRGAADSVGFASAGD
jgi:tetratricopeptide (TPR) repeat protein